MPAGKGGGGLGAGEDRTGCRRGQNGVLAGEDGVPAGRRSRRGERGDTWAPWLPRKPTGAAVSRGNLTGRHGCKQHRDPEPTARVRQPRARAGPSITRGRAILWGGRHAAGPAPPPRARDAAGRSPLGTAESDTGPESDTGQHAARHGAGGRGAADVARGRERRASRNRPLRVFLSQLSIHAELPPWGCDWSMRAVCGLIGCRSQPIA